MLFDLLDMLEWYRGLHPAWQTVIDILDRSLPYADEAGNHQVDGLSYQVLSYVSTDTGTAHTAEHDELHVILEGEEMCSLYQGDKAAVVVQCTTGMFILFKAGEQYRHGQQAASPTAVHKVIFRLPEPAA